MYVKHLRAILNDHVLYKCFYYYYYCCMTSGGTFGELRLDYEVQELNILEEATQDNATVYEYYNSPKLGKVLPMAGTSWDVKTQIEPLKVTLM